jgi:lipopolysaccharide transport system ATP-binding protein
MPSVIKVEGLGKKFIIGHESQKGYTTFRESIMNKIHSNFVKVNIGKNRSEIKEEFWALKDISFDIQQGERVGIIGRNGAGKSTLLKILSRITEPTTGTVKIKGRVASLLEVGTGFHPELTGRENIFLNGAILGMSRSEIKKKFDEIVDFSEIEKFLDTPVKRYSSGMYVRLAFAVAAHLEPEILLVDEVLAVGDIEFQRKCLGKMEDVSKNEGRSVLFVSHNMAAIRNLCELSILLDKGKLIINDQTDVVIDNYSSTQRVNEQVLSILIDNTHRKYEEYHIRIADIKRVTWLTNDDFIISSNTPIEILLEIFGKTNINDFRIAGCIKNNEDNTIGTFFSDEILNISKNQTLNIKIIIADHFLAKGSYYFNFSVGKGNSISPIVDYDHVSVPIEFQVVYDNDTNRKMISNWNKNWGSINFKNLKIEVN